MPRFSPPPPPPGPVLHGDDQECDLKRKQLEAEFKQCDTTLDKMVASHQGELSSVMATYSTVSFGSTVIIGIQWIWIPSEHSY